MDGGSGGTLQKIGQGRLTLTRPNTYTGGTTIDEGTLLVKNRMGSATGTGLVTVNGGTLAGVGKIDGAVIVGNNVNFTGFLLPGNSTRSPGILTINNALTFGPFSTYQCVLKRAPTPSTGQVKAVGVTINNGATFSFIDNGTGTLTTGTVFTVISNTSASAIGGTFSNLADGSILVSNGTNFQANYEGGTGNDLTLTVVP